MKVVQRLSAELFHLPEASWVLVGDPGHPQLLVSGTPQGRERPRQHRAHDALPVCAAGDRIEDDHRALAAQTVAQEMKRRQQADARTGGSEETVEVWGADDGPHRLPVVQQDRGQTRIEDRAHLACLEIEFLGADQIFLTAIVLDPIEELNEELDPEELLATALAEALSEIVTEAGDEPEDDPSPT